MEEMQVLPAPPENQEQLLHFATQYQQLMLLYEGGIKQITTKLDILNREHRVRGMRTPIETVKSRLKTPRSIADKLSRRLHLVVEVPVYLSDSQQQVRVEIQIRTIAMDFWASLEHELHYKLSEEIPDGVAEELAQCAGIIAETDRRMEASAVRLNQLPKPGAEDASAR